MRFVCDSCRAQYMISDDKVGAKGVKVRCKKCGYVILVRRPDAAAARPPAQAPAPMPAPAAPPVAAAPPEDSSDVTRPGVAMPPLDGASPGEAAAPPPEGIPVPAALFPMSGGAPALDAEQTTSPSSLRLDALAKTAENPVAAGANGGLGGEAPFEGSPPSGSVFSGVQEDEIGAVFDQVLSSAPHKLQETPAINPLLAPPENEELKLQMDSDLQSTRVVSTDALKKLAEEAEAHANADEAKEQAKKNGAPDWFVAVDEQQVGPLGLEKIKDMWDRGEIGPDSLCWRAGMPDWTPLSDVKELASELAPKPTKPVVAAPATSVVGSVVTVPVESTFNSGGVSRVVRTEVPMAAAAPEAGAAADSGAWKPSAASALASLVSEEMSALSKKPKPRSLLESSGEHVASSAPSAAKGQGLLDIPSAPGEASGVNGKGLFPEVAPAPAGGIAIGPMTPAPALAQSPNAPYAGPAAYGGPVPYPAYASPAPPHGLSMGLKIALGGGGALVLVLVGLVVFLIARPAQPVIVQPPPAPTEPSRADLPMPPPPAGTTAIPAQPAQPPAVAPPPATTTTPPAVAAAPSEPPAKPEVKPVEPVATREPRESASSRRRTGSSREEGGETIVAPKKTTETAAPKDDFDDLFGDKKTPEAPADNPKKRGGYIPPAPGGGDVKEELTDADVMQVVLKNKSAIVGCKDPSISGKLVMQWIVLTSGRTTGVTVISEDFKGSSVAKCLTGLIKGWTFPRHRTQRDPIKFPFSF